MITCHTITVLKIQNNTHDLVVPDQLILMQRVFVLENLCDETDDNSIQADARKDNVWKRTKIIADYLGSEM